VVTPAVAAVEELQELLLIREVECTRREEALFAREEKAGDSERALAKVSADLNTERTKERPPERSTSTRWWLTPPSLSTPSTLIRCWGRRRLSSMGESPRVA
jgi:hypothetical protein